MWRYTPYIISRYTYGELVQEPHEQQASASRLEGPKAHNVRTSPSPRQAATFPATGRRLFPADLHERSVSRARPEGLRALDVWEDPDPR